MALKDVIGHEKALGVIYGTLARDRVSSAYLFSGESGIGKRFTAINLAKAINCMGLSEDEGVPDACDVCHSCRKIDAAAHPDLLQVAPEKGEIRVNQIRAVEEALSLKPYEGKRKIVIIDEADTMNQSAANAFLKTLEEPPDESMVILISAHPGWLPETIRSRCSRINFTPLSPENCGKVIGSVAGRKAKTEIKRGRTKAPEEPVAVTEPDDVRRSTLIRLAMGRPGLALSSDMIKERERFTGLLENMLDKGSETWTDREEIEQWLDTMLIVLRDMAVLKTLEEGRGRNRVPDRPAELDTVLLNVDMKDFLARITSTTDMSKIIETYTALALLKRQVDFNLNKGITWNYAASVIRSAVTNEA